MRRDQHSLRRLVFLCSASNRGPPYCRRLPPVPFPANYHSVVLRLAAGIMLPATISSLLIPIFDLANVEFRPDMWAAGFTALGARRRLLIWPLRPGHYRQPSRPFILNAFFAVDVHAVSSVVARGNKLSGRNHRAGVRRSLRVCFCRSYPRSTPNFCPSCWQSRLSAVLQKARQA